MPPPPAPRPSAVADLLTDLSAHLSPGWQLVDLAIRAIRKAKASRDFLNKPNVVAVLDKTASDLNVLLSSKMASGTNASKPPTASPSTESSEAPAADTDAQPESSDFGSES